MGFPAPETIAFDVARRVSVLTFPAGHGYGADVLPDGEWVMRGGICWPVYGTQPIPGVAVLAGQSVAGRHWVVFREHAFLVIDPMLGERPEGGGPRAIVYDGIAGWLNKAWSAWYCTSWYWSQPYDVATPFRLDVGRSEMIKPKPCFVEVVGFDRVSVSLRLVEFIAKGRLKFAKDGMVADGLAQWQSSGVAGAIEPPPAVHALMCLVAGVSRSPWRDRSVED